jgi:hypothetical protein
LRISSTCGYDASPNDPPNHKDRHFIEGGMFLMENEIIVGIGGAAGDGGASTGDNLALTCTRQGLHVYVYTS